MSAAGSLRDRIGLCQWFHLGDRAQVEGTLAAMAGLGVRHLRTAISWADYHRPGGEAFYGGLMERLEDADVEVLLSVWLTPPSLSLEPGRERCSVPPRRPRDYADFLDRVVARWGPAFSAVEIWNEPNNPYKWDPAYDPDYTRFAEMAIDAGHWLGHLGVRRVFGGVPLLDTAFLHRMRTLGVFEHMDVLAIHAFPDMWDPFCADWDHPTHWYGWPHRVREMSRAAGGLPVWVTETGLATWRDHEGRRGREALQAARLREALHAPVERVYWYSLFDLAPARAAIEEQNGGPREEAEYHMGLVRYNPRYRVAGYEKPAWTVLHEAMAAEAPRETGARAARR